jgi:hypothetical protein
MAEADNLTDNSIQNCASVLLLNVLGAEEIVVGADLYKSLRALFADVCEHLRETAIAGAHVKTQNSSGQEFGSKLGDNIAVNRLAGVVDLLGRLLAVYGQDNIVLEFFIKKRVALIAPLCEQFKQGIGFMGSLAIIFYGCHNIIPILENFRIK